MFEEEEEEEGENKRYSDEPLHTEKIFSDRKTFFIDLKANNRGKFLKITEDVRGHRDTIMVPAETLAEFIDALQNVSDFLGNDDSQDQWALASGHPLCFVRDILSRVTEIHLRHNPDFTVLAETGDYIVVDKPAPLLIHPSVPGNPPTLLDGLQALLAYDIANGAALSIINRLDRETSGVVLVAKNKETARNLNLAMQERRVEKEYVALVHGKPKRRRFTISAPILRAGLVEKSEIWVKQIPHPDGSPCCTQFEILKRLGNFTLMRASPKTGRMHQIRVHAKQAGLPIVGDKIYGPDENCYLEFILSGWTEQLAAKLLMPRQALHCRRMAIPEFGEWQAEVPEEFEHLLTADCPSPKVPPPSKEQ